METEFKLRLLQKSLSPDHVFPLISLYHEVPHRKNTIQLKTALNENNTELWKKEIKQFPVQTQQNQNFT